MTTELEKRLGKKPTGLPQTLQTGQRGVKLFYNDEFVGYENVVTVSNEQLAEEAGERQIAGFIKGMSPSNTKKIFQYMQKKGLIP